MRKNDNLTSPPRERVSVAIQGIDRSTPDDLCKDGTCEQLHNLRFKDSAWRPVSAYAEKQFGQAFPLGYKVVYKHPASPEDKYIVEEAKKNISTARYYYYEVSTNDTSMSQATLIAKFDEKQKVSHFGNVLMFMGNGDSQKYLLKDGVYQLVNFPECASTEIINSSYASAIPAYVMKEGKITYNSDMEQAEYIEFLTKNYFEQTVFFVENVTQGYSMNSNLSEKWHGEIMLFTTFRMEDGTNINPSPLHLVKSHGARPNPKAGITRTIGLVQNGRTTIDSNGVITYEDVDKIFGIEYRIPSNRAASAELHAPIGDNTLRSASHILRIRVPEEIDTSAIVSVAVWSTRINPTYSFNRVYTYNNANADILNLKLSKKNVDYYTEFDFSQPFYLLEEIKLKKFVKEPHPTDPIYTGKLYYDIILDGVSLENIISNSIYTANNNIHDIINPSGLDYNDAFHFYAPILHLAPPYKAVPNADDGSKGIDSWVDIPIDNLTYNTSRIERVSDTTIAEGAPFAHIISYPDFRAKTYNMTEHGVFPLTPASANNFALYHAPHTENEKFPPISWERRFDVEELPPDKSIVSQLNRIQVSSPNNIFSFPFDTSYRLGNKNNRIIALQSAAIEMSDAKFGEFPLFAFTEEGIFALQAGSTTLYASIIPINYDKIINPNTLAINGGIIYITEQGVHLLSARGDKLTSEASTLISSPIHDKDGRPPLDFLRDCQIMWPKQHNEVIFHNPDNGGDIAYVYNLDAGYWSTRSLKGTKLNTDEMVDGNTIYNLADEDETALLYSNIVTRPIKLGNVEFKRLETIIPRISGINNSGQFTFFGAVKPNEFKLLRTARVPWANHLIIRRTPFSAKYFKAVLEARQTSPSFSITHIDFEWYRKFQHRMR